MSNCLDFCQLEKRLTVNSKSRVVPGIKGTQYVSIDEMNGSEETNVEIGEET